MSELIMTEEGSTPATPSGGNWKIYPKAGGLYLLDDLGIEIGPMVPRDGWIPVYDTWTYASATTATVPSNATLLYKKGWGVRYKQGGSYKYGYITNVTSTVVTINGGSDYALANSGITDVAICPNPETAFAFPGAFNWNANPQGYSAVPTDGVYQFKIFGEFVWVNMVEPANGTSNATTKQYAAPIIIAVATYIPSPIPVDNGASQATGYLRFNVGGTTIDAFKSVAAAWTSSGGCRAATACQGFYKYS